MGSHVILVVDDDPAVGSALARVLRGADYELLVCETAGDALEALASREVGLVISDYEMPEIDGLEFLARVRALYPQVRRMLLTAHAEFQVAQEAINRAGVCSFLVKPWDPWKLRLDVAFALDRQMPVRFTSAL